MMLSQAVNGRHLSCDEWYNNLIGCLVFSIFSSPQGPGGKSLARRHKEAKENHEQSSHHIRTDEDPEWCLGVNGTSSSLRTSLA